MVVSSAFREPCFEFNKLYFCGAKSAGLHRGCSFNNNLKGDAASVIELWAPAEWPGIKSLMTAEALEANRNKFRAAEALNLHMLMLFGPYYIADVEYDFGTGGKVVLKTPMKIENGQFLLTNELNGNHFYDQISGEVIRVR